MTGRHLLAAVLLAILAHVLAPYIALVIAAEVAIFAGTLGVLGWLAWTGRAVAPVWRPAWKENVR